MAVERASEKLSIPNVQVTIDRDKPSGLHGFFRAFGITSGVMAAITAVVLGIPILICGGCLISMIGIGATAPTPPRSIPSTTDTQSSIESIYKSSSIEHDNEIKVTPEPNNAIPSQVPKFSEIDSQSSVAETLPVAEIRHPDVNAWGYRLDGHHVNVDDDYIRDVRIVISGQRSASIDALFENRTNKPWRSNVQLEVVNRYGFVLSRHNAHWAVRHLERGKRYSESFETVFPGFRAIFGYSTLSEPKDFYEPEFIVVSY